MPIKQNANFGFSSDTATVNVPANTQTVVVETSTLEVKTFARINVQLSGSLGISDIWLYQGVGTSGTVLYNVGVNITDGQFNFIVEDPAPVAQYTLTVVIESTAEITGLVFVDQL